MRACVCVRVCVDAYAHTRVCVYVATIVSSRKANTPSFVWVLCSDLAPEPNDEEETAASTQAANGEGGEGGEQPVQEFIGAGADDDEEEEGRGRSVSYDFEFNLSTYVAK